MSSVLHAGVATEDITPEPGCALGGYRRFGPSRGILDRLELSALVLSCHSASLVWVTIDNIVFLVRETDPIRSMIADFCRIPKSHVMVSFSHTHSGPSVDDKCVSMIADKAVAAVRSALASQKPAALGWSAGFADATVNRRSDGTSKASPGPAREGPVDRRIGILRIDDSNGRPLALVIRYTAHGTVLGRDNLLVSADWPGAVRRRLRSLLNCPILVVNGSAGDANPRWRGSTDDLARMGTAIAQPVLSRIGAIRTSTEVVIDAVSETVSLECEDLPEGAAADRLSEQAEQSWGVDAKPWRAEVARRLEANQRRVRLGFELQVARVGDGCLAGVPMETFAAQALDFADRAPMTPAFLNGYTNGWIGYLPADEDLARGGYEVSWAPIAHGVDTGWLMPVRPGSGLRVVGAAINLTRTLMS